MSQVSEAKRYVVHFKDGHVSDPLDRQTVRDMVEASRITVLDRVSKDGSSPREFYLYDEFVDLWDLDSDLIGLFDEDSSDRVDVSPPSAAAGGDRPSERFGKDLGHNGAIDEMPAFEEVTFHDEIPDDFTGSSDFEAVDGQTRQTTLDEKIVEEAMPPPLVLAQPSPSENSIPSEDTAGFERSPTFEFKPTPEKAEFKGYDPLQDRILDPMTIFDLLIDSSLYTVLTVSPRAGRDEIHDAYLNRVSLLAALQRQVNQADHVQISAIEGIRRLFFQAQEVLRDPTSHQKYQEAGREGGGFPPAGAYLGIDSSDYRSIDMGRARFSTTPSNMTDVSGSGEARAVSALQRALSGSFIGSPHSAEDSGAYPEADMPLAPQLKIYTNPLEAIKSETETPSPSVGGLFADEAPAPIRPYVEDVAQADFKTQRRGGRGRGKTADLQDQSQYREGLRWGVDASPQRGVVQALGFTGLAILLSLTIILLTDLGTVELKYSSPSIWFFGRVALLITLAMVGTTIVRKEPLDRIGLALPLKYLAVGAGVGMVLGLVGSRVAPIYMTDARFAWLALLVTIVLQALSHEMFFRGYVTRVLLVGIQEPAVAIAGGCLLYGLFYLSYWNVLQIHGYFRFYYSILLFGFGIGGVFGWLYYKSRSIWPAAIAHFIALGLSAYLAPTIS